MSYFRIIDANLARLSEGLRVIEDVCRFELSSALLTRSCKSIRDQVKITYHHFPMSELINSRSTGTDVRAKSTVPSRDSLKDLLTANIRRATQACRTLEECTQNQSFTHIRYDLYHLEQCIWKALSKARLKGPGIYVISDSPEHLIACAKKNYVPIVQYRNKSSSKHDIFEQCQSLANELKKINVLFIVNDHVDIAISVNADGVHVGQDDMPIPFIRNILGQTKIIGRTTHSISQGISAAKDGADYVSVGPIWDTPSKPNRSGIGFDYLKEAHQLPIPFVAIGGINKDNIHAIAPHHPPLIGAIRATDQVDALWHQFSRENTAQ